MTLTTPKEARSAIERVRREIGGILNLTRPTTRDAVYAILYQEGVKSCRTIVKPGGFKIPRPPARELADTLEALRRLAA